jgi:hypothetical protein
MMYKCTICGEVVDTSNLHPYSKPFTPSELRDINNGESRSFAVKHAGCVTKANPDRGPKPTAAELADRRAWIDRR